MSQAEQALMAEGAGWGGTAYLQGTRPDWRHLLLVCDFSRDFLSTFESKTRILLISMPTLI